MDKYRAVIWQDEGDAMDAMLVSPNAIGNYAYVDIQQRENVISLNIEGAKALIKELQWLVKNQDTVVKECKR